MSTVFKKKRCFYPLEIIVVQDYVLTKPIAAPWFGIGADRDARYAGQRKKAMIVDAVLPGFNSSRILPLTSGAYIEFVNRKQRKENKEKRRYEWKRREK